MTSKGDEEVGQRAWLRVLEEYQRELSNPVPGIDCAGIAVFFGLVFLALFGH